MSEPTQTCPYCNWPFTPTEKHTLERVLPYCSLGCRRLSVEKHVAFEERHVELTEFMEREAGLAVAGYKESVDSLADLPDEWREKLASFLWHLVRLPAGVREHVCLLFQGLTYAEIGRVKGVTKQAAHKATVDAATKCDTIANYTGLGRGHTESASQMLMFETPSNEGEATR
jgi:hypothetical protein